MKNLIIQARAIPGVPASWIIQEAIAYAQESDVMVEVQVDGVSLHILPLSTPDEVKEQYEVKTGQKKPRG